MRIGIVGCGLIGRKRAQAALSLGHRVAMVADVVPDRAASLAGEVGARPAADWRDVAACAEIDAVVVATSHDELSAIGAGCLAQGKHVLIEKPAGRNLFDVTEIAAAAEKAGCVAKVGLNHRFHPGLAAARRLIDEGAVGPLCYIRGRYGHGGRLGYEQEWRCDPVRSGGGELIDQGIHLIDLARWYLGELVLDYAALPTFFWNIEVEDNCFLALRGAGGTMAWLHATWTEWKNMFSFEIVGRDGKLTIEGLGGSYGTERLTYHKMLPQMGPPETTMWEYPFADTSWVAEFEAFDQAISGRPSPIADIADARAAFALIDAAYAGVKT
jgi:predicted dehydrogenase